MGLTASAGGGSWELLAQSGEVQGPPRPTARVVCVTPPPHAGAPAPTEDPYDRHWVPPGAAGTAPPAASQGPLGLWGLVPLQLRAGRVHPGHPEIQSACDCPGTLLTLNFCAIFVPGAHSLGLGILFQVTRVPGQPTPLTGPLTAQVPHRHVPLSRCAGPGRWPRPAVWTPCSPRPLCLCGPHSSLPRALCAIQCTPAPPPRSLQRHSYVSQGGSPPQTRGPVPY